MDERHPKNGLTQRHDRSNQPDFDGWKIDPARESWLRHPALAKGGMISLAAMAIWMLGDLAKSCIQNGTLSESVRMVCLLGIGVLILLVVAVTGWTIIHETRYAKNKKK